LSLLELIPIVMALHIWVEEFAQKKILFHTDNAALVIALYELLGNPTT
jgi:hypothetical protein